MNLEEKIKTILDTAITVNNNCDIITKESQIIHAFQEWLDGVELPRHHKSDPEEDGIDIGYSLGWLAGRESDRKAIKDALTQGE